MSDKKQSSVEWLEKAFYTYAKSTGIDNDKSVIKEETLDKLFEQAKAMHRKEIEKAWNERAVLTKPNHYAINTNTGQEYYNETFGE